MKRKSFYWQEDQMWIRSFSTKITCIFWWCSKVSSSNNVPLHYTMYKITS